MVWAEYYSVQTSYLKPIFYVAQTIMSVDILVAQRVHVLDSAGATYPAGQGVGVEVPLPLQALPSGHDEQLLAPKRGDKIVNTEVN